MKIHYLIKIFALVLLICCNINENNLVNDMFK